jgi:hypothetical protein
MTPLSQHAIGRAITRTANWRESNLLVRIVQAALSHLDSEQ